MLAKAVVLRGVVLAVLVLAAGMAPVRARALTVKCRIVMLGCDADGTRCHATMALPESFDFSQFPDRRCSVDAASRTQLRWDPSTPAGRITLSQFTAAFLSEREMTISISGCFQVTWPTFDWYAMQ